MKNSGYSTNEIFERGFKNKFGNPISKRYIQLAIKNESDFDFNGRTLYLKIFSLRDIENILRDLKIKDEIVKKRFVDYYKKVNEVNLELEIDDDANKRKKLQAIVFKRDSYECVNCGSAIGLECHHKLLEYFNNLEKEINNCVTLCYQCHRDLHY